jgi:membrane-bound serine protease (ClpP class)
MKNNNLLQLLIFVFLLLPHHLIGKTLSINEISLLSVNSAITPATYDYLKQNFESLPSSSFIVLKLNTPGGLVSTTKDIITLVGRQKRPFAVWITPEGASASSAGAIIASAAHYIFMSPGTNMGAATPVGLSEDIKESDGRKKALNDLTALVRSLSSSRGRPHEPFEKMITKADSYTAQESEKLKIIDGIIFNEKEIENLITSKSISIDGEEISIETNNLTFKIYDPSLGQKILEVLANPSTAYILFLLGIALLYFEFQAPGGYIAGAVGVCFLILSGISFQVLPLDWGSMGLILAGIFLLILELFVVSYGILSIAGLIAFVMGSLFLFHGEAGFISIEYPIIFSSLAGVAIGLVLIVWYLYKENKKIKNTENFFLPIGATGHILTILGHNEFQVKVKGEIWHARSQEDLEMSDTIEVYSVDDKNLILNIKKHIAQP